MFRIRFVLYDYVSISIYHIINRCRRFLGMDLYEIRQEMAQRIMIIGNERRGRLRCFSLLLHINRCSKILLPPASSASSDAVHKSDSR